MGIGERVAAQLISEFDHPFIKNMFQSCEHICVRFWVVKQKQLLCYATSPGLEEPITNKNIQDYTWRVDWETAVVRAVLQNLIVLKFLGLVFRQPNL